MPKCRMDVIGQHKATPDSIRLCKKWQYSVTVVSAQESNKARISVWSMCEPVTKSITGTQMNV